MSMRMRGGAVVVVAWMTLVTARAATAQPANERPGGAAPEPDVEPVERVRLDLGVTIMSLGGGNGGVAVWPSVHTGLEIRMAGPAWLIASGHASYREHELDAWDPTYSDESTSINGGGRLGVRLETPVFEWLELGGHATLGARYGRHDSLVNGDHESIDIGAQGGVGAHLRPKRFFGMRLGLDVVRAGRSWSRATAQYDVRSEQTSSAAYAEIIAWPTFEMTFTF